MGATGTVLSKQQVVSALAELPGWESTADESAIEKTFTFADFSEALGFIVRVGVEAERINHHPHLTNVWNRVTLRLNTHDAGNKVTARDVKLAKAVEGLE